VAQHPNRRYFILKSIVINNLYGVDIMEEAAEICKLRLFLKLVAQVERVEDVEPLPDIDFNIRAGNTLVGYATREDVERALTTATDGRMKLMFEEESTALQRFEERAADVERLFGLFRQQQTELGGQVTVEDKAELRRRLDALDDELNRALAREYGVELPGDSKSRLPTRSRPASATPQSAQADFAKVAAVSTAALAPTPYSRWLASHRPLHWFVEFYGIMRRGGFDVVIGNPPYVEYKSVPYTIQSANAGLGNLHAMVTLRGLELLRQDGGLALIVPVALASTERMLPVREELSRESCLWMCHFDFRPSKLFEGAEQRLTIFVCRRASGTGMFTTKYNRWYTEERQHLFSTLRFTEAGSGYAIRPVWPKTGSTTLLSVLQKAARQSHRVREYVGTGVHPLFYKSTGILYFTTFTRLAPECFINDVPTSSSREVSIAFPNFSRLQVMHATLNSSLFYVLYVVHSNCRDLNPSDILSFRIPADIFEDQELLGLSDQLHAAQQATSRFINRMQRLTGQVRIQAFFPSEYKQVVDQIDRVLARHYGFTDEELDFIINYDIKYRMGEELAAEEND